MRRAEEGQQFPSGHQQPPWLGSDFWDPEFSPRVEVPFLLPMAWIGGGGSGGHSKPRDKWFRFLQGLWYCRGRFPKPQRRAEPLVGPASSAHQGTVPSTRDAWDSMRSMERGGGKDPGIRQTPVTLSRVFTSLSLSSLTARVGSILEV